VAERGRAKHVYRTFLRWDGWNRWTQSAEDFPALACSTPPEFRGEPHVWTPEHLFLAAIESCIVGAFMAYATHAGIDVHSYKSSAEATMVVEGKALKFVDAVVRPRIAVAADDRRTAAVLLEKSHARCPLVRSVNFPIRMEPVWTDGE